MANETMNLNAPILTLDSDTILETAQSKADLIWHDIQNAYRTRKILTGILGGMEKTEAGRLSGSHPYLGNDDQSDPG